MRFRRGTTTGTPWSPDRRGLEQDDELTEGRAGRITRPARPSSRRDLVARV
ncbi:hypothetical protein GJR88_04545 [Dietzia sp. DQ12-45-1b]|nr:hypothetical protein GJR88_04545 [Dietzia sp. DQ12-45-1b]